MKNIINIITTFMILFTSQLSFASERYITLQSTTSVRDSGLLSFIIPKFKEASDIDVKVIANGTGQAIRNATDCNGDLLLVHSLKDETNFVNQGYGIHRHKLMYNDFVIIGPSSNPAKIQSSESIDLTLKKIANSGNNFISRSDDSGTHKKEISLWNKSEVKIEKGAQWYIRAGQGMGATLNIAIGMNAYTLTDRSTWLKFMNKASHNILYESRVDLKNEYGIIVVNPQHCSNVKLDLAQEFVNWLISDIGKETIKSYNINNTQVFFVD